MKKVEEVMHHPDGRPTPSLIPEGKIVRPTPIGVARSGPTLLEKGVEDGEELLPVGYSRLEMKTCTTILNEAVGG